MPDSTITKSNIALKVDSALQMSEHSDEMPLLAKSDSLALDTLALDSVGMDSLIQLAAPIVVKPTPPPPPPAWMSGIEPMPRPIDAARDPSVAGIFLLLFLILAVSLRHSRKLFAMLWRDLTSIRSREKSFDERTPADKRLIAVFHLQLVAFLALLTQCWLRNSGIGGVAVWSSVQTIYLLGLWSLYYIFAQCAYRIVGYTFAQSSQAALQWVRGFNASQVFAGFVLSIPAICAVFWPETTTLSLNVAIGTYLVARVVFIIKGFRIFYTGLVSLLYFFLYLCTLEIVPLLITYRLALSLTAL